MASYNQVLSLELSFNEQTGSAIMADIVDFEDGKMEKKGRLITYRFYCPTIIQLEAISST